jgi:glycosyltransferase involved in cell wall biosynthesis
MKFGRNSTTEKSVSIIIPALNEEQSIEQVVRGLVTSFPDSEIIVVNDGSTDKTGILASQAGALVGTRLKRDTS